MSTLENLRRIANMAGAPTMDYAPEVALVEQRRTLDAIAAFAADAINEEMLAVKFFTEVLRT